MEDIHVYLELVHGTPDFFIQYHTTTALLILLASVLASRKIAFDGSQAIASRFEYALKPDLHVSCFDIGAPEKIDGTTSQTNSRA